MDGHWTTPVVDVEVGGVDVARAAWLAAGAPDSVMPAGPRGACARCGRGGAAVAIAAVVSKSFTGHDTWRDPAGQLVCTGCAWCYRTPSLRLTPLMIRRDSPAATAVSAAAAAAVLAGGPIDSATALVVPLHPGRKHLVPTAQWGRVAVDDVNLAWTVDDAARLAGLTRLRAAGFGARMLRASAPAWGVVQQVPRAQWAQIDADWQALASWRARLPWLEVGLSVTRGSAGRPA